MDAAKYHCCPKQLLHVLASLYLLASNTYSQEISFELYIDPNPPVYAFEWEQRPDLIVLYVNNFSSGFTPVILKGRLFDSGGDLVAETDNLQMPVTQLNPEFTALYPIEFVPSDALIFYGDIEEQVARTGRIPEGVYQLCVEMLDPEMFQPLTPIQCGTFFIQGYDPPILVYPPDGFSVTNDGLSGIIFQWTPVNPTPTNFLPYYKFGLFELLDGQAPKEAILSNPSVYEELITNETHLIWQPEIILPPSPRNFVWSIQALNQELLPLTYGDGWCEPFILVLLEDTIVSDTIISDTIIEGGQAAGDTIVIPPGIPYGITTTERPPADTIVEEPPWIPPPEEVPPDTFSTPRYCGPNFYTEPGIPIDLGMVLENPGTFPYPRAVPVRAEGIDFDYSVFLCTGCGDEGKFYKSIEDHVNKFTWKLEGPGSLNSPFDLKKLLEDEDSLKNIKARLQEIEDSLSWINEQIDKIIPEKIANAEKKLEERRKELKEKDSLLAILHTRQDSVDQRLDSISDAIAGHKLKLEEWKDSIDGRIAQIDSLQMILEGGPSPEMLQQLDKLNGLRTQLKSVKAMLEALENETVITGQSLALEIEAADARLNAAVAEYQSLRDRAEALAKQITGLETTLMVNKDYREFLVRKREWNDKVYQFTADFLHGDTLADDIYQRQAEINSKGTDAISTANPAQRLIHEEDFFSLMNSFKLMISSACSGKTGAQLTNCLSVAEMVETASDAYSWALDTLIGTGYVYDRRNDDRLDSLELLINAMEADVEQAKANVEEKAMEAQEARDNYVAEMNRLEEEKADLASEVLTLTDAIAGEEMTYDRMKRAHADTLEAHREKYLADIHEARTKIASFEQDIIGMNDSIAEATGDSLLTSAYKKEMDKEVESSETYRERLSEVIDNLEKLIENLERELDKLRARKAALEKEKEELEKKKEEKEKKKEEKLKGNKTAAGIFVYYIPPPLEEVMKNKAEFERLKEKVKKAEDSLALAYEFKQMVQFKLVREIEKIARSIDKFGELDSMISSLENRKSELEAEIAALKNNKTIEQKDKQLELQRILDEAKEAKQFAEENIEEYEQDSVVVQEAIDELKEQIEEKDNLIAQLETELLEKNAQWKYEEQQLRNIQNTHRDRAEELEAARNELNMNEEAIGRAKNDLTRASATDDQAGANAARQTIENLQAEGKAIETRINSLETQLASAVSSLESAQLRVKNAEESFNEVLDQISEEKKARGELEDELDAKNEEMEEALTGLEHWRKTKDKAEQLEDKTNDAREDLQEEISQGVNNDEEVKRMQQEMDDLDKRAGDAEKAKADMLNAINKAISKKDEIIKEADDKLEAAKEKLEEAEQNLEDFLLNEFNTVDFKVSLEIRGEDQVLDLYRHDDPEARLTKQLMYQSSRIPKLENKYASGTLPDLTLPSNCVPVVSFNPTAPPLKTLDPVPGREPRTIALIYKNGEPLWKQWPVLPEKADLFAKDVVPVDVGFSSDVDEKIHACFSQSAECQAAPPLIGSIIDLGRHQWESEGRIISINRLYNRMMWEPPIIPRPYPEQEKEIKCKYNASALAPDPLPEAKSKPLVKPGFLIEVTDSIVGVPEGKDTLIARVVTGDHKGLAGEDIEFSLIREAGESEDYGFEGSDSLKVKKTDGDGYAKVAFHYGDGFAKFKIFVKWKRGEQIIEEDQSKAVCPITLQFVRFSGGVSTEAWEAALEAFEAGSPVDEDKVAEMASGLGQDEDESDTTKDIPVHAIVGLIDHEKDFVEEEKVIFEPPENITLEPDSAETKTFGLARTEVKDLPPDAKINLTAMVEEKYEPLGRPGEDDSELSTTKIDRFKIGSSENLFVIILDEPVSEGEPVTGTGKLGAEIADGLMIALEEISLNINDVELEGDPENKIATAGSVSYAGSPGISANMLGFDLTLDSLVITASVGAGIGGTIRHSSMETAAKFYGEMEPTGDFLGTLEDLPELGIGGFKIMEGASFSVDMHTSKSPSGFEDDFKGIIIHSASLEFPEAFNTNEGVTPSRLHAEDLFIGSSGVGGTVSYSGSLLQFGFAGYHFEVDSVSVEFENAEIKKAALSGSLALPSPMEGKINATISKAGETWAAAITTDDPVSIPRLATAFTLMDGTGLDYNGETGVATFNLDAVISSENYGDITIRDFMINSEGKISASDISINKAIEFGAGFSVEVESLSFLLDGEEYNLTLKGGFAFPLIGAKELKGTVTINPGPIPSVAFDSAVIEFNYNPVNFKGSLAYSGNEFKGQFAITLENLKQIEGISGLFIIGSTESAPDVSYTYWYAEMVLAGAVPLGQTGLSLLELGGGVGWNYNPPVGSQPGSPVFSKSFSFKAIIGMGTTPGGEIMAGRMEMILGSGYFTLYGKLWILEQRESMYGEGSLSIFWSPVNKLEGFVGMFVGIPDAKGEVLIFEGRVNFLYSDPEKYIRSEKIEGVFLQALQAKATIDITPEHINLDGELFYNLDVEQSVVVATLIAHVHVKAEAFLHYAHPTSSLSAGASFHGDWDVDITCNLGTADVISGELNVWLSLEATPSAIQIAGSASVSYSVWFISGSENISFNYPSE